MLVHSRFVQYQFLCVGPLSAEGWREGLGAARTGGRRLGRAEAPRESLAFLHTHWAGRGRGSRLPWAPVFSERPEGAETDGLPPLLRLRSLCRVGREAQVAGEGLDKGPGAGGRWRLPPGRWEPSPAPAQSPREQGRERGGIPPPRAPLTTLGGGRATAPSRARGCDRWAARSSTVLGSRPGSSARVTPRENSRCCPGRSPRLAGHGCPSSTQSGQTAERKGSWRSRILGNSRQGQPAFSKSLQSDSSPPAEPCPRPPEPSSSTGLLCQAGCSPPASTHPRALLPSRSPRPPKSWVLEASEKRSPAR